MDGDLRFAITLADGRSVTVRRVLVATGLKDVLPEVSGLAEHWGHGVVHFDTPVQEVVNNADGILAGATQVPGVWMAGNATDLAAQVGAVAAAGALAGAHINSLLATTDTDAALAAAQGETPAL